MTNELFRNIDKARDAVVGAVKGLPQQIRERRIELPKVELEAFGRKLSVPSRTIDLTQVELPKVDVFTDKLGQAKVFAPIDLDAVTARVNEVGDYLQTLPAKLSEVPSKVQGFVSDLPESATKLVEETTTKAKAIVEDLKTRPILFVPARKQTASAPKKTTKKSTAKKSTKAPKATSTTTAAKVNGSSDEPTA